MQSFAVPVESGLQILVVFLELLVVDLSGVLFLLTLLQLSLRLLNLLPNVSKEEILVETVDVSKLYLILLLVQRGSLANRLTLTA